MVWCVLEWCGAVWRVTCVGYASDELLREGQFPGRGEVESQQVLDDGQQRQRDTPRLRQRSVQGRWALSRVERVC